MTSDKENFIEAQEHQQHQQEQQQHCTKYLQKQLLHKMDSDFWQHSRTPFGLHAATALVTNQFQQQQQQQQPPLQHFPQHFSQQNVQHSHLHQLQDQDHHHHHGMHQQTRLPPQEHNHHLLFNAAAAAAAAAHLSGVVKSNESQNCNNNADLNSLPQQQQNAKHDLQQTTTTAAQNPNQIDSFNMQLQQQQQQQQLQQNEQQQQQLCNTNEESLRNQCDTYTNTTKQHEQQPLASNKSDNNKVQTVNQQQQAQYGVVGESLSQHQHQHQHQHHNPQKHLEFHEHHSQKQTQQDAQQTSVCPKKLLEENPASSPSHSSTIAPPQSPQPSLTPSGGCSTPDIKFNNEKIRNDMQLQLSRSNSAAAISERTLEECWSTLQRLFMHKSAMQQIQQIPRLGPPGTPGSISSETKPHRCQQCMKSFSSNHQLVQHIRVHTGEKPYKCTYCERRFKQLSHVQQHTRLHTGERPYKCHLPDCGRAFIQLSNLQQHLRNHDAQVERAKNRPFHCNICGKGFATESSLRTHTSKELQLHLGVLQQHAALIGGPNATSCPACHKLFLGTDALMEHMKNEHKEKNLQNNMLGENVASSLGNGGVDVANNNSCLPQASSTSSSNDGHLGKRRIANHPCPICGKHYVNEGSLRKHLASHTETSQLTSNLRMWPCSVCQAVFTHENGLLTHMEHMRMDPKHQFAAQYVLSRAAAERRERDSILAASFAASAGGSGSIMPLMSDDRGNNSGCPSPSAHSECSSNGRLSSSEASEHESSINLLSNNNNTIENRNNNNNCSTNNNNSVGNKMNDMLHTTPHSTAQQISSQYNVDAELNVANRMSLMAAASAAAAAVAASASTLNSNAAVDTDCVDSGRTRENAAVQAAVVNLAAAMRMNQTSSNAHEVGSNMQDSLQAQTPQTQTHHQSQANSANMNRRNSPLNVSSLTSNDTINTVRETMLRSSLGAVDTINNLQTSVMDHEHHMLHSANESYGHHAATHQPQLQALHSASAHMHHHHSHHHLNQVQQPRSPETAIRMQQQAEAILRSHTEAAFRLAASVAASNSIPATISNNTDLNIPNHSAITSNALKSETHMHQQHQLLDAEKNAIQQQQQQQQQQQTHNTSNQSQSKLQCLNANALAHVHANQQQQQQNQQQQQLSHSNSDLSMCEAIRLQEHRLEQALRLHGGVGGVGGDTRSLNFLHQAQQSAETCTATQQQQQHHAT